MQRRNKRPQRRQERQKEALVRQKARAERSTNDQCTLVMTRRGNSRKESEKLLREVFGKDFEDEGKDLNIATYLKKLNVLDTPD